MIPANIPTEHGPTPRCEWTDNDSGRCCSKAIHAIPMLDDEWKPKKWNLCKTHSEQGRKAIAAMLLNT